MDARIVVVTTQPQDYMKGKQEPVPLEHRHREDGMEHLLGKAFNLVDVGVDVVRILVQPLDNEECSGRNLYHRVVVER